MNQREIPKLLDTGLAVFGVGVAGGAANELLHWWGLRRDPKLPLYARKVFYWVVTLLMIVLGGGLAWIQLGGQADALVAFEVGLAAPMFLQKLLKGPPPPDSGTYSVDSAQGGLLRSAREFLGG